MTIPSYHWWRTVVFLIPAISIYTVVLGAISVASTLVDRRAYLAHGCLRVWARLILVTTGVRVEVEGIDRLTPGATYIFVSNHQSIYDIPIVFRHLPWQLRIIAKASLGRIPFLGWHLRRAGHLLVDRSRPDPTGILARWKGLVAQGLSLIVFPEGTRSADGAVGRFKGGGFLLAIQAGLPVVPVSLAGSRDVMRKGQLTARPGRVRLTVHEPVPTAGLDASVGQARLLAERVRGVIATSVQES